MTYPEENSSRFRRQRADLAIALATQSRWEEAVQANLDILRIFPNDVDALNRLGKASIELGRYTEARDAYGKAVTIEPSNTIARKNLQRLSAIKEGAETVGAGARVDPSLFIGEAGKTTVVALRNLGTREALGKTTAGDLLDIRQDGSAMALHASTGELVGYLDPKMSARLTRLVTAGNRYEAAVTSATDQHVRVILRETYQSPDMAGRPSFPVKADVGARPYVRDAALQYGLDDDEDDVDREDDDDVTDWDDSTEDAPPATSALAQDADDDDDDEEEE